MNPATVILSELQLASALREARVWPSTGPLAGISEERGGDLGATPLAELTPLWRRVLEVLADPTRMIRATTVTTGIRGSGVTTVVAPPTGGPYVAVAHGSEGWGITPLAGDAEVAVVMATHLGLAVDAPPGGAAILSGGAWSLLAALADRPEAATPAALRQVLEGRPGRVADLFATIGPVRVAYPDDAADAVDELAIAGVLVEREGLLRLTDQGRGVLESLSSYALAGSLTVDHLAGEATRRVAMLSFLRSPDRLLMGVWSLEDGEPTVALGGPGSTRATYVVRQLIAAPVPARVG